MSAWPELFPRNRCRHLCELRSRTQKHLHNYRAQCDPLATEILKSEGTVAGEAPSEQRWPTDLEVAEDLGNSESIWP